MWEYYIKVTHGKKSGFPIALYDVTHVNKVP